MTTNFKFLITPDQILFPEFPKFDLFVKKKINGWIWTDEVYTWSCLPGYTREFMGTVKGMDLTDVGGKGNEFYLFSRPFDVDNPATNPCYGILHGIPKDFPIGSTGQAGIHYGGAKVEHLLMKGEHEAVLYSDWKLVNVY